MKGALQSHPAPTQQTDRHRDVSHQLLTEAEAARHCRYFDRGCANPVRAFQQWARRAGVPVKRVARARLYDVRVLDAFLERDAWTLRHAPTVANGRARRNLKSVAVKRLA